LGVADITGQEIDEANDPLIEPVQQWEERYHRNPETSWEPLGIDDPALPRAPRDRIDRQKQPYTFLGLSHESAPADAPTRDEQVRPAETENPLFRHPGDQMPSRSDPAKIGRYRVARVIGQGGFGRVYLAHDPDLDRDVAIKVPIDSEPRHSWTSRPTSMRPASWPGSRTRTLCQSTMWAAPTAACGLSFPNIWSVATWRPGLVAAGSAAPIPPS
jgi:hypothetical protein